VRALDSLSAVVQYMLLDSVFLQDFINCVLEKKKSLEVLCNKSCIINAMLKNYSIKHTVLKDRPVNN